MPGSPPLKEELFTLQQSPVLLFFFFFNHKNGLFYVFLERILFIKANRTLISRWWGKTFGLLSIKPSGIQKKQNSEPTESASSLGHHKKVESRGAGCEAVEGVLTQAIQSPEVSRERGHMGGNHRGAWLLDPGCPCPQRLRSLVGRNGTTPEKKSLAVKEKAKDNLHCHPAVKPLHLPLGLCVKYVRKKNSSHAKGHGGDTQRQQKAPLHIYFCRERREDTKL